ncbi:FAD-dependent monooxygenase [Bradyrhizobium sp.]|jgi:2-polyprenyl-6-methoxyphenol hydroxylase-like FAD-dependent oxidoreductase|uniref:FAD-dependent monooxygenase n=1 Tax=Bradyrhizobium sp. TaxID=376 RepID=UPI003C18AE70
MDTQVVIVGAGPVGLTLAIDLGRRGVRCTLVEQKAEPQFLPKMERCNARTMEIFRRIGLADQIRAAGLTTDSAMDVYIILSMTQAPLLHLKYPSVDAAREQAREIDDGSAPLEPYQLISQYTLEPLLKSVAEKIPCVTVRYAVELVEFEQQEAGVVATVRAAGGRSEKINAAYLVGCDGGSSLVRKQLGIRLRGEANLAKFRQGLYRCDELFDRLPLGQGPGRGRHYLVADQWSSFLIMQDSKRYWTMHAAVESDEEMKHRFEQVVGVPVRYEMVYCGEWRQNLLLADRYRDGRVFLAGDAVHLVIPAGGLGMNTGVGDAIDLSWKLAATLEGWGGPGLLESYEIERRQIGERNIGASRYATLGYRKWRSQWRPEITDATAVGQAIRDDLGKVADVEQRKVNEMIGAELGYRYVDSPVIDNMPGGPEHLFRDYRPTTWPGARLPHTWLADGTPVQDHIPTVGYTLLRLRNSHKTDNLKKAFFDRGVSLTVLDIADESVRAVYDRDLLLLRPDMHVVWRGNQAPENAAELAALATGHAP